MHPVIALVGRPNVGKSTLFNRLTKTRDALVADLPGLTRDRKYGAGKVGQRPYIVIDTGGISGMEEGIDEHMANQSLKAVDEADVVLFLVDAQAGLTSADRQLADYLRRQTKTVYLVVNKIDGKNPDVVTAEFYELGLGEISELAAAHNRGVTSLIEKVLEELPEQFQNYDEEEEANLKGNGTRIAVVGRPNVGKSTLVNRLLGEERVVVYDYAGTTRDSVYIPYDREGKPYTLIDTAGIRRRKNISEAAEKFSIIKALQAIQDADVCVLVLDARDNLVEQDLTMLSFVLNNGRSLVIAVNKWDGMTQDDKDAVKRELDRRLDFIDWADIHFISALHGTGVGHLYESIDQAYVSATTNFKTSDLTRILEDAVSSHQPPMVNSRRPKLRYVHQGGKMPPLFIVHGNQTERLPDTYKRYLANTFRRVLNITGTPIRFEFKTSDNPYAEKKAEPRSQRVRDKMEKRSNINKAKETKRKIARKKKDRKQR